MDNRAWVIARREFVERVRSKWFIVTTVLGPLLMIGLIVVPGYLGVRTALKPTTVVVVAHCDPTLAQEVGAHLQKNNPLLGISFADVSEDELLARIRDNKLDGYLVLPRDLLDGGKVFYFGANASSIKVSRLMGGAIEKAVRFARGQQFGVDRDTLAKIDKPVPFEAQLTSGEKKGTSGIASFVLGYAVALILYMAILLYAVNVMRSVLEEKTNRVVEVMVASVKPTALMAGKIGGVGSVGLLQLSIWATTAAIAYTFRDQLLGLFGLPASFPFELPSAGIATLAIFLLYFLFGYFFFASIYAAVGAMCSSDQEAQQVQAPIVMLLVFPMVCMQVVSEDPRGHLSAILTQIPFASPVLMPMRYVLGGATLAEVGLSLGLLILSLGLVVFLAARIYRVGILMYGKRPSLGELGRWIRSS